MTAVAPSLEFFEGIPETLADVRLRRSTASGLRNVLLIFDALNAIERFQSFRARPTGDLSLRDEEGRISITPTSVRFIFGGDEGDTLRWVECAVEIDRDDHWARVMRFLHRYAAANGMEYRDSGTGASS
ncbi:MAG: photosystem II reaction center protein Psb28 [Spirulinaceae cyanobacterium RM2_2_10]|nr:photosystem II reaction center protein Psb28 [Spirulinaceae cyanobacterium RM2_2_10]